MSWGLWGSPESPLGLRNSSYKGLGGRRRHKAKPSSGKVDPTMADLCVFVCACTCVVKLTPWEVYYPVKSRGPLSLEHLLCAILSQFLQWLSEVGLLIAIVQMRLREVR